MTGTLEPRRPAWVQRIVDECSVDLGRPEIPLKPGDRVRISPSEVREWGFHTDVGVIRSGGDRYEAGWVSVDGLGCWVDYGELTLIEECV